jgi:predicted esterase
MNRALLTLVLPLLIAMPLLAQPDHETGEFVLTAPKGATYTLIVPDSYDRKKGATLFLWLHGAGDSHTNAARGVKSYNFRPDWIFAVPDAKANGSWQMEEEDRVMEVVDRVQAAYNIRRTFIGGFSRGGFFTFGFGLNHTDRFAGYLCIGGGIPNPALAKKEEADRIAIAIVHGEADPTVPFDNARTAREAFEKAGWKEKLFFRSVPGLGHTVDRAATQAAVDWLDENAQVLKEPKDYFAYGMKLFDSGQLGRAYWALGEISEETSGREKWWKTAKSTREKIEKEAEKAGKKVQKEMERDRNANWLPDWREYDRTFEGVPFHAEVKATFDERVKAHNAKADELWTQAGAAKDAGDPKAAIEACLAIRDECPVADGESVAKAKALLSGYRADEAVAKKHKRLLQGTEEWK